MRIANLFGGGRSGPSLTFEVQVFKTDHWITETVCGSEEEARALAAKLLPQREGVRVLREYSAPNGATTESVLFSEMRAVGKRPISIVPIEEAPVCQAPKDYLGFDSRQTISRILRQYLEEKALTASELLHNPGEMKRAMNFEALVPNAISRVATLQVKATGEDVKTRRDSIYAVIDELRVKAEKASKLVPEAKKTGFSAAMAFVEKASNGDAEEADYLTKVMICRDLVNVRNLLGKIEYMLELGGDGPMEPKHMAVLDGLVADALSTSAVVQDLLGRQSSLVQALIRTIDIIEGTFEPQEREQAPAVTTVLSRWLASGQAPQSRQVLMEFLCRNIRGTQRLLPSDPEGQRGAYKLLLARLFALPGQLFGGAGMAEALTQGFLRFLECGGGEGRRQGIDGVVASIDTGWGRILYLLELAGSELGRKEVDTVLERLRLQVFTQGGMHAIVPMSVPLKPKMQIMSTLYERLIACSLPEAERTKLADRVDEHVSEYIVAGRIIEKLDDPNATLRVRATRLVQFASTDVLASPKARRIVRDQIIGHLRQPNFDGKFVEGLNTDAERAAAIKGFYELLARAKFM